MRSALGSRVLFEGGQQGENGTKTIRITPFGNRFHTPLKPYKEKDISQRDWHVLGVVQVKWGALIQVLGSESRWFL